VLSKAAKAISIVDVRSAQFQAGNQRLKYQLDQINDWHSRKRVRVIPNERPSNAEEIKAAIDRAALKQRRNRLLILKRQLRRRRQQQQQQQL
jgi:hypothetical protein